MRRTSLVVITLGGLILIIGIGLYWSTISETVNIRDSGVLIKVTPRENLKVETLRLVFDASEKTHKIIVESEVVTNRSGPISIYALIPYTVGQNVISKVSHIRAINHTTVIPVPSLRASLINFTFYPKLGEPFPDGRITAYIEMASENLVVIQGMDRHAILATFYETGNLPHELLSRYFAGLASDERFEKLEFIVRLPKDAFLLQDTFPSPSTLLVTQGYRSAVWRFQFNTPQVYKTSVVASYASKSETGSKNFLTFISGVFVASGISVLVGIFFQLFKQPKLDENPSPDLETDTDLDEEGIKKKKHLAKELVNSRTDRRWLWMASAYVILFILTIVATFALVSSASQDFLMRENVHAQMIVVVSALFGFAGIIAVYRLQSIEEARRHEARWFLDNEQKLTSKKVSNSVKQSIWDSWTAQLRYGRERSRYLLFVLWLSIVFTLALASGSMAFIRTVDPAAFPVFGFIVDLSPFLAVLSGMTFFYQFVIIVFVPP